LLNEQTAGLGFRGKDSGSEEKPLNRNSEKAKNKKEGGDPIPRVMSRTHQATPSKKRLELGKPKKRREISP